MLVRDQFHAPTQKQSDTNRVDLCVLKRTFRSCLYSKTSSRASHGIYIRWMRRPLISSIFSCLPSNSHSSCPHTFIALTLRVWALCLNHGPQQQQDGL
jgi:hypothetical protein